MQSSIRLHDLNSRTVVRNGTVVESFGYVFLDYRGSLLPKFNSRAFFGAQPSWREHNTKTFAIEEVRSPSEFRLDIRGVRVVQECRFAMFQDWIAKTLNRIQIKLHEGEEKLGDDVKMVVRKPADVLGTWAEEILGPAMTFIIEEGGAFMPASGFLKRWRSKDNARFLASILPVSDSNDWESMWGWDERNWFLYRKCVRRAWAVLKCPVCLFEQFWDVTRGEPEHSCPRCGFRGNKDGLDLDEWQAWANAMPLIQAPQDQAEVARLFQENYTIYSAVCERYRNAITGEKCETQKDAVLRTLP